MNGKWGWAVAIVAAAVLAYVIVDRLDNQALAVLTGAVCGALAGVPITALTFWLIRRERIPQHMRRSMWQEQPPPQAPPPQVIVVQQPPAPPPPTAGLAPWQSSGAAFPPTRPPRNFNIVGDEEEEDGTS